MECFDDILFHSDSDGSIGIVGVFLTKVIYEGIMDGQLSPS